MKSLYIVEYISFWDSYNGCAWSYNVFGNEEPTAQEAALISGINPEQCYLIPAESWSEADVVVKEFACDGACKSEKLYKKKFK